VVNSWSARKAYHLTSSDGIHNWKLRGLAYDPTTDFVRYSDGTVNHWNKMAPGRFLEDGHLAAFTFAVIDIPKQEDRGNEPHDNKVIVVPFDGTALDHDLQNGRSLSQPALSQVSQPRGKRDTMSDCGQAVESPHQQPLPQRCDGTSYLTFPSGSGMGAVAKGQVEGGEERFRVSGRRARPGRKFEI
jgi:hypothetical protein